MPCVESEGFFSMSVSSLIFTPQLHISETFLVLLLLGLCELFNQHSRQGTSYTEMCYSILCSSKSLPGMEGFNHEVFMAVNSHENKNVSF